MWQQTNSFLLILSVVTARPEILSLSVMKSPSGSDSAPQRLRCEVEGHPPPKIVWLSASRRMKEVQVQTSKSGPYRVVSSVPYQEGEVLTCRAESRLGEVERGYPPSNTLMITLTVCGLIALLLLLLVGVLVYCLRNRARADTSPVYPNAQVVEDHRQHGFESLADGYAEVQPVYSTVTMSSSTSCVHYSPVNVQ
uniref:sialic acid binding Ig-like lectin 15, like isoform X3 n=1 Tax=Monopterus albus TaxID=43700 RepID=UPI0009B459E0|nr:uncharacterized protein LOC109970089 isoform X3 [Monopterus albus]